MTAPDDSDAVLGMVRLGWYIAEVRGRNRPGVPPAAPPKLPDRTNHALPLERERTAPELRIEAQAVLKALADRAGVDQESSGASFGVAVDRSAKALARASAAASAGTAEPKALTATAGAPANSAVAGEAGEAGEGANGTAAPAAAPGAAGGDGTTAEAAAPPGPAAGLAGAVRRLAGAARGLTDTAKPAGSGGGHGDGTVAGDWDSLADLIYKFDAHIQDTLAAQSVTQANGYQLGRALAECYWALDPSLAADSETWASWLFLLGDGRCAEIGRLLGRLSAYFDPYTAPAIAGSVQVWKNVAKSAEWQQAAYPTLYAQIRRWYELILLKQDPTTLIQPYQLLKNYRLVWRTLRGFWGQLVLAALAAGAVAVFAWLLTQPTVSSWVKTLLAALGIAGFSVAGLAAKVKNDAQAMLTRLKQDAYTDLIALAITTAPLPPRSVRAPRTGLIPPVTSKGKMTSMMRQRSITPITPA